MFWWLWNLLANKKEEMVKKGRKSDGLGFEMGIVGPLVTFRFEWVFQFDN